MIFLMFEKHKKFCLIFLHQKLHRNRFFLLAISDKRGEKIIFKNNFQLVSLNTCKSVCYFLKKVILGVKSVGVAGFEPATSCSQSRRDDRATLYPEKDCNNTTFLSIT